MGGLKAPTFHVPAPTGAGWIRDPAFSRGPLGFENCLGNLAAIAGPPLEFKPPGEVIARGVRK